MCVLPTVFYKRSFKYVNYTCKYRVGRRLCMLKHGLRENAHTFIYSLMPLTIVFVYVCEHMHKYVL